VAEAIQNVIPLAARERSLRAFSVTLDALLIDALLEWEDIQLGSFDAREITRRWHTLMKLRHEAETKNLTIGLPVNRRIFDWRSKPRLPTSTQTTARDPTNDQQDASDQTASPTETVSSLHRRRQRAAAHQHDHPAAA
jgi:hypothetical protein